MLRRDLVVEIYILLRLWNVANKFFLFSIPVYKPNIKLKILLRMINTPKTKVKGNFKLGLVDYSSILISQF